MRYGRRPISNLTDQEVFAEFKDQVTALTSLHNIRRPERDGRLEKELAERRRRLRQCRVRLGR
jgi:hypothetical protein